MNESTELVDMAIREGVGVITINNPPVNALSPVVAEAIIAAVGSLQNENSVQAIVLIGGGKAFSGGADIKEFGKITAGQKSNRSMLREMLAAVEDCPKPIVAAI